MFTPSDSGVVNMTAAISRLPPHLRPVMLSSLYEDEISHGAEMADSGELHRNSASECHWIHNLKNIHPQASGQSLCFVCFLSESEKAPPSDIFRPQHLVVGCLHIAPI